MNGTVNISRKLWQNTVLSDGPFSQREAWIWMIAHAAYKAHDRTVSGKTIRVERGQLAASYRFLAERFGWSIGTVQRFLVKLSDTRTDTPSDTLCDTDTDTGVLRITIRNYDKYQPGGDKSGTPDGTLDGTASGTANGTKNTKGLNTKGLKGETGEPKLDLGDEPEPPPKTVSAISPEVEAFNHWNARVQAWNANLPQGHRLRLSAKQKLTPADIKSLSPRIAEAGGVEDWKACVDLVVRQGQWWTRKSDREWKPSFAFFLQAKSINACLNGKYGDPSSAQSMQPAAIEPAELARRRKILAETGY